jgi:hypothetical protein
MGGRDYPRLSIPALGPTQHPVHCLPSHSRGENRLSSGVDNPPTTNAEVKERAELHFWAFMSSSRLNITYVDIFITVGQQLILWYKLYRINYQECWLHRLHAEILDGNSTELFVGEMPIGGAVTLRMFESLGRRDILRTKDAWFRLVSKLNPS